MKPLFFLLAVALLAAACRKNKPEPPAAPPVTKQITFDVFAGQDYSGSINSPYGYKAASVKLTLEKIIKKGSDIQAVWDTTFTYRSLTEFPLRPHQYRVQKGVPVVEAKEALSVKYEIWYGSLYNPPQPFGYRAVLEPGQNSLNINVAL